MTQTAPPSHTLTDVIYQSNLVEQEMCGPCCDGYHICDATSVCRPTPARDAAFCVPSNATQRHHCGVSILMNQDVSCESCDEPSPAAELYEAQFSEQQYEPQFTSSRRRLLMVEKWAAAPSNAMFCQQDQNCKVRCKLS